MRAWGFAMITVGMLFSLVLVCGSLSGCLQIPLPAAVLIALGLPDAYLLWAHRRKMSALLSQPSS